MDSKLVLLNDKRLILVGIVAGIALFGALAVFVGQGNVRHVPIFWKETIRSTVAFQNIDGETKVIGIAGNGEISPTLIMRSGDYAYVLTVINQDTITHMFYVSGLHMNTKVLRPGENDTITLYSKNEGIFKYYDRFEDDKILGEIRAVKVTSLE